MIAIPVTMVAHVVFHSIIEIIASIDRKSIVTVRSTPYQVPLRYTDDVTQAGTEYGVTVKRFDKNIPVPGTYQYEIGFSKFSLQQPTKKRKAALLVLRSTIRKESVPWHFRGRLSPQHYLLHAASCAYDEPTHLLAPRFVRSQGKSAKQHSFVKQEDLPIAKYDVLVDDLSRMQHGCARDFPLCTFQQIPTYSKGNMSLGSFPENTIKTRRNNVKKVGGEKRCFD